MTRALVVVDLQKDFTEGGSLAVAGGNRVGQRIAATMRELGKGRFGFYEYVVATKDFHIPADSNGGHISDNPDFVTSWPAHCIQGTDGALFQADVADVGWSMFDAVFYKGQGRPDYSGFQGYMPTVLGDVYLLEWLRDHKVTRLDVVGLATDYCVKATALDAVQEGFEVRIPVQLTAAVGGPGARDKAIRQVNAAQGDPDRRIN